MFHINAINLKILDIYTYVNVKVVLPSSIIIISNYFHGWEVHKSWIWHLSSYSMDATFRSNLYRGWNLVCCIHMQNHTSSNSASSIMAGLNIDQSNACVLAFFFSLQKSLTWGSILSTQFVTKEICACQAGETETVKNYLTAVCETACMQGLLFL